MLLYVTKVLSVFRSFSRCFGAVFGRVCALRRLISRNTSQAFCCVSVWVRFCLRRRVLPSEDLNSHTKSCCVLLQYRRWNTGANRWPKSSERGAVVETVSPSPFADEAFIRQAKVLQHHDSSRYRVDGGQRPLSRPSYAHIRHGVGVEIWVDCQLQPTLSQPPRPPHHSCFRSATRLI